MNDEAQRPSPFKAVSSHKPLLPSDIVTASQSRIAAALAMRQEIKRLAKIADELDSQALQDLTDIAGAEGAERLRERMLEAFEQSGVPQEDIDSVSQLTGAIPPHQTTSTFTTPAGFPVASDKQSVTEDVPRTAAIETQSEISQPGPPSIPAAPMTADINRKPDRDLAENVIEICGFHLTGKMVESGRKIAVEASEQVASGIRSPASRYDRCFGRHAWQKDLYHAAFNQALVSAGALPGDQEAPPTPPRPSECYQAEALNNDYMPWETPPTELATPTATPTAQGWEKLSPPIKSQKRGLQEPAIIVSNDEMEQTNEVSTIPLTTHSPDQDLASGRLEAPINETAENVVQETAIMPPTQHSPSSPQRRSTKDQTTEAPDEEDILYGAENEANLEELGDGKNNFPAFNPTEQFIRNKAHAPAPRAPIAMPNFLRENSAEPIASFHRIGPPPPRMPSSPPKYAKGL